jgi:hypothetical protein
MANNTILEKNLEDDNDNKKKTTEWKTIGVRIRNLDLPILNRQLDRLNYSTLGDLAKDLINGKITKVTEEQQIDIIDLLHN